MRPAIVALLPPDPAATLAVLQALAEQPEEPEHQVVLVDGGAAALAPLLARVEGEDVDVVRLDGPVSAGAALEAGLRRVERDVAIVLLPDAVPGPGIVAPLLAACRAPDVRAAVAGTPAHAAAARCLAFRVADLPAVPDVDADRLAGALLLELGAGTIATVPEAPVTLRADAPRARGDLDRPVEVSVVIPTLDATSDRVRACVRAVQSTLDAAHEIVLIDNGAPPQGFSAPVNAGLRAARGRYVVVLNDDVEVLPGWWPPLRDALDAGAAVVFPRTVDAFDRGDFAAWCFAMTRETRDRHSSAPGDFFALRLKVWFQDTDLLERLRAAGTPPVRIDAAEVRHTTSSTIATPDPELQAWIRAQTARDRAEFEALHPGVTLVERAAT